MKKTDIARGGPGPDCASCVLGTAIQRRDFIRGAAERALATLAALAIGSRTAAALEIGITNATGQGQEKSYPIPAADGVFIDKDESVIIARFQGRVYAFSLACPHQNTALRWDSRNGRFQCPKHKSRYQPDGVFIDGRATRGMDRFAVRRDGNAVLVDFNTMYREDDHPARWASAFVALAP